MSIECSARDLTEKTISWKSTRRGVLQEPGTLKFAKFFPIDLGKYVCEIENSVSGVKEYNSVTFIRDPESAGQVAYSVENEIADTDKVVEKPTTPVVEDTTEQIIPVTTTNVIPVTTTTAFNENKEEKNDNKEVDTDDDDGKKEVDTDDDDGKKEVDTDDDDGKKVVDTDDDDGKKEVDTDDDNGKKENHLVFISDQNEVRIVQGSVIHAAEGNFFPIYIYTKL